MQYLAKGQPSIFNPCSIFLGFSHPSSPRCLTILQDICCSCRRVFPHSQAKLAFQVGVLSLSCGLSTQISTPVSISSCPALSLTGYVLPAAHECSSPTKVTGDPKDSPHCVRPSRQHWAQQVRGPTHPLSTLPPALLLLYLPFKCCNSLGFRPSSQFTL